MKISFEKTAENLLAQDNILILTHKNPDGDAHGSAMALCLGLRSLGKNAFILANEGTTFRFMFRIAQFFAPNDFTPDYVVAVDSATGERLSKTAEGYLNGVDLAIDHHISHREYAKETFVDGTSAACGEIIYELLCAMKVELTGEIAEALYIAISTDTSCFLNANTTPRTHEIAAKILPYVPDFPALHREFFVVKSKARLKVESLLISNVNFYLDGRVAVMHLSLDDIDETEATEDDLDNIVSLARCIDGVELGILLRETEDGNTKASLRSGDAFNVSDICAHFGGGGHIRAAGATLNMSLDAAEAALIEKIEEL